MTWLDTLREADAERAQRAVGELVVREVGGECALALGRVVRGARHVLGRGEQHTRLAPRATGRSRSQAQASGTLISSGPQSVED